MFRATGLLLAAAAVVIFLYGAMQFARASQGGGGPSINLGDGTTASLESPARQAASRALAVSGVLLGAAAVVIVMDQGRRKSRRRNTAARA